MTVDEAYRHCATIAEKHYENFPVASLLVPKAMRLHLVAIYAFSRMADDVADEGNAPASERLSALANLRRSLRNASPEDPVFTALATTIHVCHLPLDTFDRLLDAFTQDVEFVAPSTWEDVLEYCSRSANPVGELFLRLAYAGKEPPAKAIDASNHICTALQITNFLQDLNIDLERGRAYLPLPDDEVIRRTRDLFREGSSVVRYVHSWRLKMELWFIIQGGQTMLELCAARTNRLERPTLSVWNIILRYAKTRFC